MNDSLKEKERIAIERLKAFEPDDDAYWLAYSGGKDSDCIRILAQLAGVRHELHHNLTTVDAPETIYYIRSIPGVQIDRVCDKDGKHITMWNLIVKKKMPPTRLARYCCEVLKESGGKNRLKITGVRWDESRNRKDNGGLVKIIGKPKTVQRIAAENGANFQLTPKGGVVLNLDNNEERRVVEHCYRTTTTMVNPIIDWTDRDVWDFLHHYGCEGNPLYQCGESRIGCIGCPMQDAHGMKKDFAKYPKYKANYIRAFDRMLKANPDIDYTWETGLDVYKWWVGDDPNQMSFFEEEEI